MKQIIRFIYHKIGLNHFFVKFILYNKYLLKILTAINSFRWKSVRLYVIIWPPAIHYLKKLELI